LILARRGDLSKIAIISELEEGWLAGTGAFFMHFIGGMFLPFFVRLYTTSYCQNYLLNQCVGGTMNNLNQKLLADFVVPMPPLDEQRRIVAKIEELLPLINEYGAANDELEQMNAELPEKLKKSILQEAIMGKLGTQDPNDEPASELLDRIREEKKQLVKAGVLKKKDLVETPVEDDEIPFEIPESWEWVRYKDIANCELGKTKNPNEPLVNLAPYLCAINVYWGRVDLTCLKEMPFSESERLKYSIKPGDMLICEGGEAGRTAIWTEEYKSVCYQNALHRVRFYSNLNAFFYMYQMFLYKSAGYLEDYIKGETIKHFVLGKLQSLPIPLPPLAEQHRIVEKIEALFAEVDHIEI
jgi:type I restriction enzyme S subunit